MLRFAASAALLLGLGLLIMETVCRTGANALPLFSRRRTGSLERAGLSLLLGWMLLGTAFLGLALTGLFFKSCLVAFALGPALLARQLPPASSSLVIRAIREARGIGPTGIAIGLAALLPLFLGLLTPAKDATALLYHLAAPWQFLVAHRVLLEHVSWGFHLPIPVDISYALPLVTGDDRLVKWQVLSCFLAANAVFTGERLRKGSARSAWLGPLMAVSLAYAVSLAACTKNDAPASALFVAGALLTMRGAWPLGALLLGFSAAAKLTYGPMIVVWVLLALPDRRRLGWIFSLLALPLLPWLIKSFLATGNPIYPLASNIFPSYNWGPLNDRVAGAILHRLWLGDYGVASLPGLFFGALRADYILVLLLIPGLLLLPGRRRWIVAGILAMLAAYALPHYSRYMLGPAWLLALLAAGHLDRLSGRLRFLVWPLAAYCLVAGYLNAGFFSREWSDLVITTDAYRARHYTTRHEAIQMMMANPSRKVLAVGEWRTHLMPSRIIYSGMQGEMPIVWQAAKESLDVESLRKKFRQLGADQLLYNHVSAALLGSAHTLFEWDERIVRLYVEYCKQHLSILRRTAHCDMANGGFYLYEIRHRPAPSPPERIWFAPGMESFYGRGILILQERNISWAIKLLEENMRVAPDVGQSWNEVGRAYQMMGDNEKAYRYLKEFFDEGMLDYYNRPIFAATALALGRLDFAEDLLLRLLDPYHCQRGMIYWSLTVLQLKRAIKEGTSGNLAAAETSLEEGFAYLDKIPADTQQYARRHILRAPLIATQAYISIARGERAAAACLFQEALRLSPGNSNAPQWRDMMAELPKCLDR